MTHSIRVQPQAQADLDDQAVYFDRQREGLGDRFLLAAERTFQRTATRPEENARYGFTDQRLQDIRVQIVDRFPKILVFYEVSAEHVTIVRVLHGSRDIEALAETFLSD